MSVVFCFKTWERTYAGIVLFLCFLLPTNTLGGIASTKYVNTAIETRVDTSESSNQTLAGTYNVSGTMTVPTPPLPTLK